ncbi:MAG: TonB-dependent receptor, partial [Ignavibacteriales bacterium]|nr:TonB-dependent receptor [Ignavibacteriales bacterium]
QVPYMPGIEVSSWFNHKFSDGFETYAAAKAIGGRTSSLSGNTLPAAAIVDVGAEYRIVESMSVTIELRNVTNQRYELWRGYAAVPLTMSVYATLRW